MSRSIEARIVRLLNCGIVLPLILRSFLVDNADEAWDAEVARRIEDLKAGKAVTVPWEELDRELLALE